MNSTGIPTIQRFSGWRRALLCARVLEAKHALDLDCEELSCGLCQSGVEDEQVAPAYVSVDFDNYSRRPLTFAIFSRDSQPEGKPKIWAPSTFS